MVAVLELTADSSLFIDNLIGLTMRPSFFIEYTQPINPSQKRTKSPQEIFSA